MTEREPSDLRDLAERVARCLGTGVETNPRTGEFIRVRPTEHSGDLVRVPGADEGLGEQLFFVGRLAEALGVSWSTANTAVLAEGQRVLLDVPTRFDGVGDPVPIPCENVVR